MLTLKSSIDPDSTKQQEHTDRCEKTFLRGIVNWLRRRRTGSAAIQDTIGMHDIPGGEKIDIVGQLDGANPEEHPGDFELCMTGALLDDGQAPHSQTSDNDIEQASTVRRRIRSTEESTAWRVDSTETSRVREAFPQFLLHNATRSYQSGGDSMKDGVFP